MSGTQHAIFKNKQSVTNELVGQALLQFKNGNIRQAKDLYQRVLQDEPNHVIALNELGRIFLLHQKIEDAATLFRKAITANPEVAIPYKNLGTTLCEMGFCEEGFSFLRRYAELTFMPADPATSPQPIAAHKVLHDQEQQAYLRNHAIGSVSYNSYHIEEAGRVHGRAINPNLATPLVAQQWEQKTPKILVCDDFLTDDALRALRKFCWGSTIWQRVYKNGYLGALPEHGIGSPLLAQIIEELKTSLPSILNDMPLVQFWSFKYDSSMKGIGVHADAATINVNFWITPNEANLNPDSGGMIIWDKPTPPDWDFKMYNQNDAAAREFLNANNASPQIIPYRANRAVIFDSSLFHETDTISFQQGYHHRRIGMTLLFGKKGNPQQPQ
ncbi:MAG: tetratricopeptide repeat protein [Alphaproteobacteria bacterium]|nr:tetratricopeptide repeat protein [Alphaproteobacteria bacterium]